MSFANFSKAGLGVAVVTVLNVIFPLVGIDVPEETTASAIEGIGNFVGFVLLIWGQVDRKDLKAGLIRKPVDNS